MSGDDIEMLAAEFVLGTLDATERALATQRRAREPALDAAIVDWERRLHPLTDTAGDATPGDLLPLIEVRIAEKGATAQTVPTTAAATAPAEVLTLRRRVSRWRATAFASGALAAGLAASLLIVLWRAPMPAHDAQPFVAVFGQGDQQPAFLLSVDLNTRELTIRPIAAEPHPGKTYQLWIVSREWGSTPRSLGLLDSSSAPTRKQLQGYAPALLQSATFGISLEPAGGSPTGAPTGPALHGTLIPTAL